MPRHLNPLADRGAANRRAAGSVVIAFIVAALVFGGFYLGSRLSTPSILHSTSAPEKPSTAPTG